MNISVKIFTLITVQLRPVGAHNVQVKCTDITLDQFSRGIAVNLNTVPEPVRISNSRSKAERSQFFGHFEVE